MSDMLVNLLRLPASKPGLGDLLTAGVIIRRAQPFELSQVRRFVSENFSAAWADEISVGFANKPVSVFIATDSGKLVGFAGYECTRRGFFGPTAVHEEHQRRGIGTALLVASLEALREMGYVYAIIGGVGPSEFYQQAVGAIMIPDSDPGIYDDILRDE